MYIVKSYRFSKKEGSVVRVRVRFEKHKKKEYSGREEQKDLPKDIDQGFLHHQIEHDGILQDNKITLPIFVFWVEHPAWLQIYHAIIEV